MSLKQHCACCHSYITTVAAKNACRPATPRLIEHARIIWPACTVELGQKICGRCLNLTKTSQNQLRNAATHFDAALLASQAEQALQLTRHRAKQLNLVDLIRQTFIGDHQLSDDQRRKQVADTYICISDIAATASAAHARFNLNSTTQLGVFTRVKLNKGQRAVFLSGRRLLPEVLVSCNSIAFCANNSGTTDDASIQLQTHSHRSGQYYVDGSMERRLLLPFGDLSSSAIAQELALAVEDRSRLTFHCDVSSILKALRAHPITASLESITPQAVQLLKEQRQWGLVLATCEAVSQHLAVHCSATGHPGSAYLLNHSKLSPNVRARAAQDDSIWFVATTEIKPNTELLIRYDGAASQLFEPTQ